MKDKVKVYSKKAMPWIAIVAFYSLLFVFGVGCPIKYATGVSCFGCGMTRAVWAAARLHFADAFYYHPLWVVLPVWAVLFIFRKKINTKLFNALLWITLAAFVVVYFIRMFDPHNHVVVFEPSEGFLARMVSHFQN